MSVFCCFCFFFSSRRRHTRCALVTGVQTCALPILHETCAEAARHLEQVKAVGDRLGLGFLGLGMWPDKARADLPVMPKGRYAIMLRHMPRVGDLGLDMMLRTCTIQDRKRNTLNSRH